MKPTNRISRYSSADWMTFIVSAGLATPQDIAGARARDAEERRIRADMDWMRGGPKKKRRKPRRGREEGCDGSPTKDE